MGHQVLGRVKISDRRFPRHCSTFRFKTSIPYSTLGVSTSIQYGAFMRRGNGVGHLFHLIGECSVAPEVVRASLQSGGFPDSDVARLIEMGGRRPVTGEEGVCWPHGVQRMAVSRGTTPARR